MSAFDELQFHLKLIERERSLGDSGHVCAAMAAHIWELMKSVDVDDIPENDKMFVLSKHLVHYVLLENYVEPKGVCATNPVPAKIRNTSEGEIDYRAIEYDLQISLSFSITSDNKYKFLLSNNKTCKTSNVIIVDEEMVQPFLMDTNLNIVKRSETIYELSTEVLTFLRGKKFGSQTSYTPVENPNEPANITRYLYRVEVEPAPAPGNQ